MESFQQEDYELGQFDAHTQQGFIPASSRQNQNNRMNPGYQREFSQPDGGRGGRGRGRGRGGGRGRGRGRGGYQGGQGGPGGPRGPPMNQGPSVFVGNIPWASTEEELTDLFAGFGVVKKFRILLDRETRRPRGMGFCEFETPEACQSAIDGLNGYELQGRQLRVDHARQRN